jgi:predicted DsbA family dithiol-disulfide isomerase
VRKAAWPSSLATLVVLAGAVALGACKHDPTPDAVASGGSTGAAVAAVASGGGSGGGGGDKAPDRPADKVPELLKAVGPRPTDADLPGFPLSEMPEAAARNFLQFAQDTFPPGGCPFTLQGALKEKKCFEQSKRALIIGGMMANEGAKASEISKVFNDYFAAFSPSKRTSFDLKSAPACQGPVDAPLTMVEFSDFECPYCAAARPLLEQLVVEMKGKLRLCWKPFPLQAHPHAAATSRTAMYALEKGKFWEMHDIMFQNQASLDNDSLKSYAMKVGLDGEDLMKAIATDRFNDRITASKEEGKKAGITGTPSIFINGRELVLPIAPETLRFTLDDELSWIANGNKWGTD